MKIQHFSDQLAIFNFIRRLDYIALNRLINKDATLINHPREADGFTPLHSAVYANRIEGVELLIAMGASPNQPCNTGVTPLGLALKTADTNPVIIKKLIIQGGAFLDKDVEFYHHQRYIKYGEEMTLEDLTDWRITTKNQPRYKIHVFPVNLEDCDNSQIVDNLRKILLSEDLDEEYVFSEGGGIERPYSPMVKNLSGCDDAYNELG